MQKSNWLWNEIREHLRDKRKSNPKNYWYINERFIALNENALRLKY